MAESTKYMPVNGGAVVSDFKFTKIFSFKTKRTRAFAYVFMAVFVALTVFLAFNPYLILLLHGSRISSVVQALGNLVVGVVVVQICNPMVQLVLLLMVVLDPNSLPFILSFSIQILHNRIRIPRFLHPVRMVLLLDLEVQTVKHRQ